MRNVSLELISITEDIEAGLTASVELGTYFQDQVDQRRKTMTEDIIGDLGVLVGKREGDRAAPGPDVQNPWLLEVADQREAALDDDLRLRTGDENSPIDPQGQTPKSPLSEDVRQRFPTLAASDESLGAVMKGVGLAN